MPETNKTRRMRTISVSHEAHHLAWQLSAALGIPVCEVVAKALQHYYHYRKANRQDFELPQIPERAVVGRPRRKT